MTNIKLQVSSTLRIDRGATTIILCKSMRGALSTTNSVSWSIFTICKVCAHELCRAEGIQWMDETRLSLTDGSALQASNQCNYIYIYELLYKLVCGVVCCATAVYAGVIRLASEDCGLRFSGGLTCSRHGFSHPMLFADDPATSRRLADLQRTRFTPQMWFDLQAHRVTFRHNLTDQQTDLRWIAPLCTIRIVASAVWRW